MAARRQKKKSVSKRGTRRSVPKKAPTRPATPRQAAILTFIRDYTYRHGYSPTYEEIADEYGISKVTVFEHLTALESRGLIRRNKYKARSLELAEHLELADERPTCLPLVGRIAAGAPIEAIENREAIDLGSLFASKQGTYVLEVKGDSMIEDQIADGDYVVVERRDMPHNGETVVALLEDGEATLKRFYRERGRIRLQPANPRYEPIYTTNARIQGVVIGVLRRF
ncbi:MAG: transcriptional repressor LexA [Phycisphaerae bacterium]